MSEKMSVRALLGRCLIILPLLVSSDEGKQLKLGNYVGRIYSDGSGNLGTPKDIANFSDYWHLQFNSDSITDKKIIKANRYAFNNTKEFGKVQYKYHIWLSLDLSNKSSEYLCVAGHNFPGKKAFIRVEKNAPITTGENGCVLIDASLDSQLKKGNQITLRGYYWPYEGGEDQIISLAGYAELTEFLRKKRAD